MIDQNSNQNYKEFPTLRQTTHLNSALYVGNTNFFNETIYTSLFHQGQIIAICRETGASRVVMSGLRYPHSLYKYDDIGIIFSDSANNRVLFCDKNFNSTNNLYFPSANWIQDTSLMSNGNLLVCDSNNHRILEADIRSGDIVDVYAFSKEFKVYQAKEL